MALLIRERIRDDERPRHNVRCYFGPAATPYPKCALVFYFELHTLLPLQQCQSVTNRFVHVHKVLTTEYLCASCCAAACTISAAQSSEQIAQGRATWNWNRVQCRFPHAARVLDNFLFVRSFPYHNAVNFWVDVQEQRNQASVGIQR